MRRAGTAGRSCTESRPAAAWWRRCSRPARSRSRDARRQSTRSGCGARSACRAFPRTSRPRGANPTIQLLCRSRIESVLFRGVSPSAGRDRAGSRCETAASLVPEVFRQQRRGRCQHDGRQPPDRSLSALPRNCAMRNQRALIRVRHNHSRLRSHGDTATRKLPQSSAILAPGQSGAGSDRVRILSQTSLLAPESALLRAKASLPAAGKIAVPAPGNLAPPPPNMTGLYR